MAPVTAPPPASPCAQLDLLALLLGTRRSVTVVGGDDQSIYGFLGATPAVFSHFRARFGAQVRCLQTNFR